MKKSTLKSFLGLSQANDESNVAGTALNGGESWLSASVGASVLETGEITAEEVVSCTFCSWEGCSVATTSLVRGDCAGAWLGALLLSVCQTKVPHLGLFSLFSELFVVVVLEVPQPGKGAVWESKAEGQTCPERMLS